MSQHQSLRVGRRAKKHRSVLKRYERLQTLLGKEEWKEGDSVFGLPKVKTLRIRVKKEKAAEVTAATPEEGQATATAAQPAAAAAPKAAEKGAPKEAAAAPKKEAKKEKGK